MMAFSLRDFAEEGDTYIDFRTGTREIISEDDELTERHDLGKL